MSDTEFYWLIIGALIFFLVGIPVFIIYGVFGGPADYIKMTNPVSPEPQYNANITVKSVHYFNAAFRVPCMVLTTTGETYGVLEVSDCMKLENSTALIYANEIQQIMRVKVMP